MEEHNWSIASQHVTSEGLVTYLHCSCGDYEVRISGSPAAQVLRPPQAA